MGRELRLVNFSSVAQDFYRLFHGVVFHCGYQLFSEETDIYTTAPDIPVMETKQVVPVHAFWGTDECVRPHVGIS